MASNIHSIFRFPQFAKTIYYSCSSPKSRIQKKETKEKIQLHEKVYVLHLGCYIPLVSYNTENPTALISFYICKNSMIPSGQKDVRKYKILSKSEIFKAE